VCVCMYTCMYVCMYTGMYVCVYMYVCMCKGIDTSAYLDFDIDILVNKYCQYIPEYMFFKVYISTYKFAK